jgi:hypothetical protein
MRSYALNEYQLVRPDGTVLWSAVVPEGERVYWEPALGFEIMGLALARRRELPEGEWVTYAEFPDGYPGWAEWSWCSDE